VFEQYSTEVFLSFDNARNIRLQKKEKKMLVIQRN